MKQNGNFLYQMVDSGKYEARCTWQAAEEQRDSSTTGERSAWAKKQGFMDVAYMLAFKSVYTWFQTKIVSGFSRSITN